MSSPLSYAVNALAKSVIVWLNVAYYRKTHGEPYWTSVCRASISSAAGIQNSVFQGKRKHVPPSSAARVGHASACHEPLKAAPGPVRQFSRFRPHTTSGRQTARCRRSGADPRSARRRPDGALAQQTLPEPVKSTETATQGCQSERAMARGTGSAASELSPGLKGKIDCAAK